MRKVTERTVIPERVTYLTKIVVPRWLRVAGIIMIPLSCVIPIFLPTPVPSAVAIFLYVIVCTSMMMGSLALVFRTVSQEEIDKKPDKYVEAR